MKSRRRRASRRSSEDFAFGVLPTIEDMMVRKRRHTGPPPNLYPERSTRSAVLTAVVDRSGRGGTRKVKAAFEEVAARYAEHGLHVSWPVSAEIVSMAIMGATKSKDSAHTLFVSVRAVESGLLDGLIAHEMGHMLRTESSHPSHSAEVFRALSREVRIPRAAEGAFGQAFNHIQDIYADDLAFLVFATDGDDRAYEFFSGWIEGNATMRGRNRWKNVGLAATNGFRSEEHTSELQSRLHLVCRLLLEKKKKIRQAHSERSDTTAARRAV